MMVDRYRNYRPQPIQQKTKRRKKLYVLALLIFIFFAGKSIISKPSNSAQNVQKGANTTPKPKKIIQAEPISSNTWTLLEQNVTAIINQNPALDVSVAVIDISSNTKANYGIQDNFAGASTTKVLTAAAYLHEVELGNNTLSQMLGSISAKEHIRLMINRSNNESWAALNTKLTYSKIEAYAHNLGMSSYTARNNTITASDEAVLLQKLYTRTILNDANTKLLLSYMQNTNNEDMIPVAVPENAVFYHKYGQLEDRLHDAAIVDHNGRPIVLVIYTKGGASDGSIYQARTKFIQQIASAVFESIYQ